MRSTPNKIKIPKRLQPILWSADIGKLDLIRDEVYIVHQIFAYGTMDDILWLLKTYSEREIVDTFKKPYKDYFPQRFYFVKDFLLGLTDWNPDPRYYVKNTPRVIG